MHPIIFELGIIKLYSYGIMIALGFLIATFFASRAAIRDGLPSGKIADLCLYSLFFGILGARLLHVSLDAQYYLAKPIEIFLINHGGLAIQGGLASGIAAAYVFIRVNKLPIWKTADLIAPYLALGQSIGRIGCLLNGCCYGKPTRLATGIYLPGHAFLLHPTQAYYSIAYLLVFIVLIAIYKKRKIYGLVFFSYLMMFSIIRFFLDYLRGDLYPVVLGLTSSQILAAVIAVTALTFLLKLFFSKSSGISGI
ncbi:MAG: prolipoprotein diacylglyceryl transferase [Candidatus Omnitrophica bacterium]|nr:prolipoprotein diacylglyceryl transferase [Candidatus Omnitrophota bacterium]